MLNIKEVPYSVYKSIFNRISNCDRCNFTSLSDGSLNIHHTKIHLSIDLPDTYKETLQTLIECEYCYLNVSGEN